MSKRKPQQQSLRNNGGNEQSLRLSKFQPLTDAQKDVWDAWKEGFNLLLSGCAGTGKTFISVYLAMKEVLNPTTNYDRVVLIRSAVSSRDVGFLPGKLNEKMSVYETPYISMLNTLFSRGDAFEIAKTKRYFEVVPTSYLRGMTFDRSIIVVDEMQNMNAEELHTIITRCGEDCRILFCGDERQDDLHRNRYDISGMNRFCQIIERMDSFDSVRFEADDIVRSGIVKEFILAELQLAKEKEAA